MKVILRQDFESLGKMGSIHTVKDGYARNFLIPKGIVYPATAKYEKIFEAERKLLQKKLDYQIKSAEELAAKLAQASVVVYSKAGEEGRLFGSVTAQDISESLRQQGIELDRRKIILDEPIKQLGTYQVRVHLHGDVNALLQVSVLKEE